MGIFGGLGRRLKDGRLADGLAIAGATLRGNYGDVAAIRAAARQRMGEQEKRARLVQAIAEDPKLSPQARAYAELDPERFLAALLQARPHLLGAQSNRPSLDKAQIGSSPHELIHGSARPDQPGGGASGAAHSIPDPPTPGEAWWSQLRPIPGHRFQ